MTLYILIYLLFLILALGDLFISRGSKKIVVIPMAVLFLMIAMLAGLRWETGTDWASYLRYFNTIDFTPLWESKMEIGYEFMVRTFRFFFGPNYTLFLFFVAIFILSFTYLAVYKISPYPLFSLFLMLSYSFVGSGFGVRQDLSICITIYSLIFIYEKSFLKFAFMVFLASLIHNSAVVFFPAYFLFDFKWNVVRALVVIVFVAVCISLSETLMQTFGFLVSEDRTEYYMEMGFKQLTNENPYITVIKGLAGRCLLILVCIWYVSYQKEENRLFNGIFNLYIMGVVLYAVFTPINLIFSRVARPYEVFQIFLIPVLYPLVKRSQKLIIISIIVMFYVAKFMSLMKASEGVFIPYKSVLNN